MNSSSRLMISFAFTASAVLLVSCTDNPVSVPIQDERYPTTFEQLSADSLETLNTLFSQANPRICTGLNEFGFTTSSTGWPCTREAVGVGEDPQIESLVERAKVTLTQNAKFTGVSDTSSLLFASKLSIPGLGGKILALSLSFKSQIYQGLQVQFANAEIRLILDTVGILAIRGNHYPDIYVPNPVFLPHQAQRMLVGHVLIWYDFGGAPREYRLTEESFCEDTSIADSLLEPVKVILPYKTERGIELRIAWRVNVGCDEFSFTAWWMYVDIVTGELLLTYQTFQT